MEAVLSWPTVDEAVTVQDAVKRLGSCGLIRRVGRHAVELTSDARHWLSGEDSNYLIAVLHANVRYIGELLNAVVETPLSHEEVRNDAADNYSLPWAGLDQVRRRTTWLRAADLLELRFDHKLVITQAGKELLARLTLGRPLLAIDTTLLDKPIELSPPSAEVAELLASLDQSALATRKAVLGYIPRGNRGDVIDSLRLLVGCASPSVTRYDLAAYCQQHFEIKDSSVAATVTMLKGTGLIEQIGLDTFAATPVAKEWLERNDDIELARIIHAHVLCFGEVLAAIDDADRATSLTSYSARAYGMPRQDVAGMRTRLQILHACGFIEETAYARYRLTQLGEAFRDSIPLLEPLESDSRSEAGTATDQEETPNDSYQLAAAELIAASTDADHPTRLERAIVEVLTLVGFDAQHVGGPGRTDVVVAIRIDAEIRRVIIDAKSSSSGTIGEKSIDFDTLREHSEENKADHVVVIGPDFSDVRLSRRAREHKVALLPVGFLAEVTVRQAATPLGPRELYPLFRDDAKERLEAEWTERARESALVTHVLGALVRESAEPDPVFGGALTVDQIYLILREDVDPKPTPKQIQQVLDLLASPLIRALERKDNKYVAVEKAHVTSNRLRSLATATSQVSKLLEL